MSLQNIDHPDAERHGGRIYIRKDDLRPGALPKPPVEPMTQPKRKVAHTWPLPQMKEKASKMESSTLRADAVEFVPPQVIPLESNLQAMNPKAEEFVPVQTGSLN